MQISPLCVYFMRRYLKQKMINLMLEQLSYSSWSNSLKTSDATDIIVFDNDAI